MNKFDYEQYEEYPSYISTSRQKAGKGGQKTLKKKPGAGHDRREPGQKPRLFLPKQETIMPAAPVKTIKTVRPAKESRPVKNREDDLQKGTVLFSSRGKCRVETGGNSVECIIPPHITNAGEGLVPGDMVFVRQKDDFHRFVEKIGERKSVISRTDPHVPQKLKTIAANVDYGVIVAAAKEPPLSLKLIDRYLVALKQGNVTPVICINKADLLSAEEERELLEKLATYKTQGTEVFICSAKLNRGIETLTGFLQGKICVFLGHSGVGKTSLLNAAGGMNLSTNTLRESDKKGRHTTTASNLYHTDNGITIIDTPGIREFGIAADNREIAGSFTEFEGFAIKCRFSDCTHASEPGCEVRKAVREGLISRERYISYLKLIGVRPAENEKDGDAKPDDDGKPFECANCGAGVYPESAGTNHRNHCPRCLHSRHLDHEPGDRAACCGGDMEPVTVWVRKGGEWAIIHRCRECGAFSSNRIAADDNELLLMSLAAKPLSNPPFRLEKLFED
ncbi:MAG: ribosome small subunit-dependent GTPase A [Firmicutes bacterium]|nr:ribosome small subunit-dependent GTPase A [Bacillota bacterium]